MHLKEKRDRWWGAVPSSSSSEVPQKYSYLPSQADFTAFSPVLTLQAYVHTTVLITLATQLEGTLSHTKHNTNETPNQLPAEVIHDAWMT